MKDLIQFVLQTQNGKELLAKIVKKVILNKLHISSDVNISQLSIVSREDNDTIRMKLSGEIVLKSEDLYSIIEEVIS